MTSRPDVWMKFYVADYVADTMELSTLEHGAYLLLIFHYWRRGPLSNDDVELARVARLERADWMAMAPKVRGFFTLKNGKLFHKRIEAEKARAENTAKKRAENGKKGGLAKAEKDKEKHDAASNCQDFASVLPQQNPRESESDKKEKKESTSLRSVAVATPVDAKAALWKEGLASLMNLTGGTRKQVAGQLGKLSDAICGDHADLLTIIRSAEVKQPDQPYAWIMAVVKSRSDPGLFDTNGHTPAADPWGINAWIDKQPDVTDGQFGDTTRKVINGSAIDHYAECIAEAAGLPDTWRGNWDCLGNWLREDLDMIDEKPVLEAVHNQAVRMNGSIASMKVFDTTIRSAAARCRGNNKR
jgi:uncharacterized protein YdaU (DUF1376 family)